MDLLAGFNNAQSGKGKATVSFNTAEIEKHTVIDCEKTMQSNTIYAPIASNQYMVPCNDYTFYKQKNNISNFRYLIKKYPLIAQKKKIKKIKRHVDVDFLKNIKSLFETDIVSNIQCIDDNKISIAIVEAYLEAEAMRQYSAKINSFFINVISATTEEGDIFCNMSEKLHWSIGYTTHAGTGFVSLLQHIFMLSYIDALTTAENILGLETENFFSLHSTAHTVVEEQISYLSYNHILQQIPVSLPNRTCSSLLLKDIILFYGYSKQVIGGLVQYSFGSDSFCLPASIVENSLEIGKQKSPGFLLNQDKIDTNHHSVVIFCYDIRTAIAFDKLVKESTVLSSHNVIITGHFGKEIDAIPWSYLYQHDVIFVGAPTEEAFEAISEYESVIMGAGARSFRVYPYWVLHSGSLTSTAESHEIVQNSTSLADVENVSFLVQRIMRSSISVEEFFKWGQGCGLFIIPKHQNQDVNLALPEFTLTDQVTSAENIDDVTLKELFPYDSVATIHGKKDVGKSYLVLSTIYAMVTNSNMFGFTVGMGKQSKCLLIDSETTQTTLSSRIRQMGLESAFISKSFYVISVLKSNPSSLFAILDIAKEEHRKAVYDYIITN